MTSLQASLKRYITIYTNAQQYEVNLKSSNPKSQRRNNNLDVEPMGVPTESQFSTGMLVANSQNVSRKKVQNRSSRSEPSMPCIFCKGNHFNDSCDKFVTVIDR